MFDPAVPGTVNVATTLAGLRDAVATSADLAKSTGLPVVAAASAGWDGNVPLFVSIGIVAWNLMPADVLTVASSLGDDYAVVRGDQFFELVRRLELQPAGPPARARPVLWPRTAPSRPPASRAPRPAEG